MTDPAAPHQETEDERRARHRFDTETAAGAASSHQPDAGGLHAGELDDADEGTIMVDRPAAPANEPEPDDHEPDDHEDGTVVVDRTPPVYDDHEDGTVVVDRTPPVYDDHEDGTVVVDRTPPVHDDHEDGTIVVDRSAPADDDHEDGTIVVDRSVAAEDGTIVVDRSAPDDGTLVVERPAAPPKRGPVMRTLQRRGGKREVTLAPGVNANKTATLAAGPGAVAEYETRAILPAPTATPVIELGPEASRANAPSMPSIAKQSRRRGLIALSVAAGAVVVSVVGLILVIGALIAG